MTAPLTSVADLEDRLAELGPLVQQRPQDVLDEVIGISRDAALVGDPGLSGDGWYLAARAYVNVGRLDEALGAIDSAREQYVSAGQLIDAAQTGLGRMNVLDDLGRHHDAIEVGQAVLDEIAALPHAAERAGCERIRAAAHENVGVSNGLLGHHRNALEAYERAEVHYLEADLTIDAARCRANRGVELLDLGRNSEAIEALRTARPFFEADGDRQFAGLCAAFEAGAHVQSGEFLEAHRRLQTSDDLLAGGEGTTDWARAQLLRAATLLALNLHNDAGLLYEDLEARFERSGQRRDHAIAILGRARILLQTNRPGEATKHFIRAEAEFAVIGDDAMASTCLLGRAYSGSDDEHAAAALGALQSFERSGRLPDEVAARIRLIDLVPDAAEEHLSRCGEILDDLDLPHLKWKLLVIRARRTTDADEALGLLRDAAAIVEQLRETVTDHSSLVPFMGSRRSVHEATVDVCLAADDPVGALASVASARSRTLIERSATATPALGTPFGDTTVRIVYEVIGTEVLAVTTVGGELHVTRHLTDIISLERLMRRLDSQWRRFRPDVLDGADPAILLAPTLDLLEQIHRLLIAPLERAELFKGATELVVVPVGLMANVPFAALFDGTHHLIEHVPVTVAASVRNRPQARRTGSDLLVVGVPDADAPMVLDEVETIAAASDKSTKLIGDAATVLDIGRAVGDHDVIHIACHGHNRSDNPVLSALRVGDGDLTAREVADFDLAGQLVVLSACSSGRQYAAGNADELLGLPRAFLVAGASAVVVNLWPVNDATTTGLMVDFHRRLATHSPRDALRLTQLERLASGVHPYHWAPATLYVAGAALLTEPQGSKQS